MLKEVETLTMPKKEVDHPERNSGNVVNVKRKRGRPRKIKENLVEAQRTIQFEKCTIQNNVLNVVKKYAEDSPRSLENSSNKSLAISKTIIYNENNDCIALPVSLALENLPNLTGIRQSDRIKIRRGKIKSLSVLRSDFKTVDHFVHNSENDSPKKMKFAKSAVSSVIKVKAEEFKQTVVSKTHQSLITKPKHINVCKVDKKFASNVNEAKRKKNLTGKIEEKHGETGLINKTMKWKKKESKKNLIVATSRANKNLHYRNIKELTVPLIRLEELPLSELSQLILQPNYIEKKKELDDASDELQYLVYNQCKSTKKKRERKVTVKKKSKNYYKQIERKVQLIKSKVLNNHFNGTVIKREMKKTDNTLHVLHSQQSNNASVERGAILKEYTSRNEHVEKMELKIQQNNRKYLHINHSVKNETLKSNVTVNDLKTKKRYSKIKKTSNISLVHELQFLNDSYSMKNRTPKILLREHGCPYACKVCFKSFKEKRLLSSHIKKHNIDVEISCDADRNQATNIDLTKNSFNVERNLDTFKDRKDIYLSDLHSEGTENSSSRDSSDGVINLVETNIHLSELMEKCTISAVREESENGDVSTKSAITNENGISKASDIFKNDHFQFVEKAKRGIKRQISAWMNINVRKKNKMDEYQEEAMHNKMTNSSLVNLETKINYKPDSNKNVIGTQTDIHCRICHKKFISVRFLNEHMYFVHDACQNMEKIFSQRIEDESENIIFDTSSRNERQEMCFDEIEENTDDVNSGNGKWHCNPCKENFSLIKNYLRHRYYSHDDKSVVHVCDNCNEALTSVAMVNIHICAKVHSWSCKRCNLKFPNGMSLTQHNMNYHFEHVGPHICSVCKLSFLTNSMMERHKSEHFIDCNCINGNNCFCSNAYTENIELPNDLNRIRSFYAKDSKNQVEPLLNVRSTFGNISNSIHRTIEHFEPKRTSCSFHTNEKSSENCTNSNNTHLSHDYEEQLKCNLCSFTCTSKLRAKVHLAKQHKISTEVCRICCDLSLADGVALHLFNRHMVFDHAKFKQQNGGTVNDNMLNYFKDELPEVLGFKRLLSLYEYQKYDDIPKDECFNCSICLDEFFDTESYRVHYFNTHDFVCLFCDIQFEHSSQAVNHKIKIHISVDSYLWAAQSMITAVLKLCRYGETLEDIILKFTERDSCNGMNYCRDNCMENINLSYENRESESVCLDYWENEINEKTVQLSETLDSIRAASPANYTDTPSDQSMNEEEVSEYDNSCVLIVTEDALHMYKNDIHVLVLLVRSYCKIFSEEYITKLLMEYMENSNFLKYD